VKASDPPFSIRLGLLAQRVMGRFFSIILLAFIGIWLRYICRYRIRKVDEIRRGYRDLVRRKEGPLLICANHLTMIDSFVITWALGSVPWYMIHFSALPWHVPERKNFAATWYQHLFVFMMKCVPIVRGGDRRQISDVVKQLVYLLKIGEVVFVFPEAGRSRSGRVEHSSAAYGVGRIIAATPECRTLCVYLRGDHQETWGQLPIKGETFYVDIAVIKPVSDLKGIHRSKHLSQQVVDKLMEMENSYFANRK
jgi:1-acyl-sn-glycerol-3-phosphate acyltransferase